jgi:hypothetical protein
MPKMSETRRKRLDKILEHTKAVRAFEDEEARRQ